MVLKLIRRSGLWKDYNWNGKYITQIITPEEEGSGQIIKQIRSISAINTYYSFLICSYVCLVIIET